MGLERRGNGTYYYRKARRGSRVVSEYLGSGLDAVLMASLDDAERSKRETRAEDGKALGRSLQAAEGAVIDYCDRVEALAHAALVVAGYLRHHRGEWRKRRGNPYDSGRIRGRDARADPGPAEAGPGGR